MNPVAIDTRAEYDYCVARGYEPLIDRRFKMDIRLRVSVQRELFGDGHSPAENEKFYRAGNINRTFAKNVCGLCGNILQRMFHIF